MNQKITIRLFQCLLGCLFIFLAMPMHAQSDKMISELTREYVYPVRVVWKQGNISGEQILMKREIGQATLNNERKAILRNGKDEISSILLDFGVEFNGAVEFITGMWGGANAPRNIRVRFGESVGEAMSDVGISGATNDHAMRDFEMKLPWLGKNQTGESGFRFVRIDFLDSDAELHLKVVRAISTYRDIPYLGSFNCDDERLNKIWKTGAYTVHLNMQDYLWDGIKRDRLVWVGDLHPEVATINAVFGLNPVVPKSLDLARDITPLPQWMSGISTYSMWWIIIHYDWYMHSGDFEYLRQQEPYLEGLVNQIIKHVDRGVEKMSGNRFLDWPSSEDSVAVHAGLQAMTVLALQHAEKLFGFLGDKSYQEKCAAVIAQMKRYRPEYNHSKQAVALMAMSGMMNPEKAFTDVLQVGGVKNFSTFYGYYMLEAMALAGQYEEAMKMISEYWGAMIDLGATTFWEGFDIEWTRNAARIDELVPDGKVDIHGTYGDYCYVGYRHSLCHGWASGPTAWLSEHVLGIKVMEPGGKVFKIEPNLGHLNFVEGTFPTKYGLIYVSHKKNAEGKIVTEVKAPGEITIIQN